MDVFSDVDSGKRGFGGFRESDETESHCRVCFSRNHSLLSVPVSLF